LLKRVGTRDQLLSAEPTTREENSKSEKKSERA